MSTLFHIVSQSMLHYFVKRACSHILNVNFVSHCQSMLRYFVKHACSHILSGNFVSHLYIVSIPQDYDRLGAAFVQFIMTEEVGGALTPADLLKKLKQMKNSTGVQLNDAYDFKAWVDPCVSTRLRYHRKALKWSLELDSHGHAIGSFAADCSDGAKVGRFGRILESTPSVCGPPIAPRWGGDAVKKMKWKRTVKSVTDNIALMSDTELETFGYTSGDTGRKQATSEWEQYLEDGLSSEPTIKWPPPVFELMKPIAATQPVFARLVRRLPVQLPPTIPTETLGGGAAGTNGHSCEPAASDDSDDDREDMGLSRGKQRSDRGVGVVDWHRACIAAQEAYPITKALDSGRVTTHLVLWESDTNDHDEAVSESDDEAVCKSDPSERWELWLATITQPSTSEGLGITAGLTELNDVGDPNGGTMHTVNGIADICEEGTAATHPVRVHWWSKVAGTGGSADSADSTDSNGSLGRKPVLDLAAGIATDAADTKFRMTKTYSRVDRRLIGPRIFLNKGGTIRAASKLVLEAAVALMVARQQIA
jgi:hypothetical protein